MWLQKTAYLPCFLHDVPCPGGLGLPKRRRGRFFFGAASPCAAGRGGTGGLGPGFSAPLLAGLAGPGLPTPGCFTGALGFCGADAWTCCDSAGFPSGFACPCPFVRCRRPERRAGFGSMGVGASVGGGGVCGASGAGCSPNRAGIAQAYLSSALTSSAAGPSAL
jgi:hypothetical protein